MNKAFQGTTVCLMEKLSSELFGSATLEFLGQKYTPDATKGYAKFSLAHPFPVLCERGTFHAATIANSWQSMRHQGFNYDHRVKEYYAKDSNIEDRYIGCILAADFPREPIGGWRLTSYEETPGIACVASVFKRAQGLGRIIGEHQTGRHEWTVSLEADHDFNEAGVVLYGAAENFKALTEGETKLLAEHTPGDFKAAGYGYVPLREVADEFVKFWNAEERRFDKPWKGRSLHLMFGGLNGQVHFKGAGLVRYGAEPTAKLDQLLASQIGGAAELTEEEAAAVAAAFRAIGGVEKII